MRKELRYIRYRICRTIYYADQCPKDYKRNFRKIAENILSGLGLSALAFIGAVLFVVLA